ncbi:MAG: hypothetical protein AB7F28_06685 [Candidatus Margulisiibacteriota bacterium]
MAFIIAMTSVLLLTGCGAASRMASDSSPVTKAIQSLPASSIGLTSRLIEVVADGKKTVYLEIQNTTNHPLTVVFGSPNFGGELVVKNANGEGVLVNEDVSYAAVLVPVTFESQTSRRYELCTLPDAAYTITQQVTVYVDDVAYLLSTTN